MKVVMVGPFPEPGAQLSGGVERVIDTLLPRLGKEVDLTLIVPGASADAEQFVHGVRTIYLRRGRGPGALRYWTSDARKLARSVSDVSPDIVHVQGAAGAARFLQHPSILTVHGVVDRDILISGRGRAWGAWVTHAIARVLRRIERQARERIKNVIVINPYVLEVMPDVSSLRTFRFPNPVDAAFFDTPSGAVARSRHIVNIGNVGPLKNTLGVLQTAAQLMRHDPSIKLTICGKVVDASYKQACEEFIQSNGLAAQVFMLGNLPTGRLIEVLDESSCLVVASRQENSPMAIAEAMARGVAVVAPKAFGIKYMISPGRNGDFLPLSNVAEDALVLKSALDRDWDRLAIAADARETYETGRIVRQTLSAYREVVAASR